jgi:DNA-binding transcriptional regulator YhcF (GntR family)
VLIEVDTASAVPAYEQIRAQIETMVGSGLLPPGTPLPSIRQLAADLGLAVNTVARAYRELENHGVVIGRVRHGTVVAEHSSEPISKAEADRRLADAAATYALANHEAPNAKMATDSHQNSTLVSRNVSTQSVWVPPAKSRLTTMTMPHET